MNPETMKRAPEMYIGTEVVRSAYKAMIGAWEGSRGSLAMSGQHVYICTHHNSKYSICARDDGVPRPSVFSRKQLWAEGIQYTIHDVACKAVAAVPTEERIGCTRCRGSKEEDAGQGCEEFRCRTVNDIKVDEGGWRDELVDMASEPRRPR